MKQNYTYVVMTFNSLWFAYKIIYIVFYRKGVKINNV